MMNETALNNVPANQVHTTGEQVTEVNDTSHVGIMPAEATNTTAVSNAPPPEKPKKKKQVEGKKKKK